MSQPFDDRHDDGPNTPDPSRDLAPGQDDLRPDYLGGDQPFDDR